MQKLYFSTQTCATAIRIAMEELAIKYTPVEVSWNSNQNVDELAKVNPLGAVPVLVTEQGKVLTQNVAILEYLADQKPSAHLIPERGTWERSEALSWLAFTASDVQRGFDPIFAIRSMTMPESAKAEVKDYAVKRLQGFLAHVDQKLAGKDYLLGKQYSVADIYLFTILGWTKWIDLNTLEYKNINSYMKRIFDRPAVKRILEQEDLLDYLQ